MALKALLSIVRTNNINFIESIIKVGIFEVFNFCFDSDNNPSIQIRSLELLESLLKIRDNFNMQKG